MASTKDYKDFIIDSLSLLDNITYKPMMGEYILYYNNVIFGGIYDDRLLVKKVDSNEKYHMEDAIPYPKGKAMHLVEEVDDKELLREIVLNTYEDLKK